MLLKDIFHLSLRVLFSCLSSPVGQIERALKLKKPRRDAAVVHHQWLSCVRCFQRLIKFLSGAVCCHRPVEESRHRTGFRFKAVKRRIFTLSAIDAENELLHCVAMVPWNWMSILCHLLARSNQRKVNDSSTRSFSE
ncbi:hypothetical protein HDV63DRAFT_390633 [Trichoderma sp. SZMC 28014]